MLHAQQFANVKTMATSHAEEQIPSSPSYEPPADPAVGGIPQHPGAMYIEHHPASEETRVTEAQSRAERLLALRAPLIERGKRVPALESSIRRHELEAQCLYDLLTTARNAENVLAHRLDEAKRLLDFERLETEMVRERLRTAEMQLADVSDLLHVKESAYEDEIALLRSRCTTLKRKLEALTTGQKKEYDETIRKLERNSKEYQKDLLRRTQERDHWREAAISSEEDHLKALQAKKTKAQSLSALLQTERTLSASLHDQLEEAQKAAKADATQNAKLAAREGEKAKYEKALEHEKAKTTDLKQQLKQADASARRTQRDMAKMRDKCEDLEKQLKDALERAVQAEERAADLERRPPTTSHAPASPRGDMLMSPAPLQRLGQPAEDIASESRSRFTATLPMGLQDEGSLHDDDVEGLTTSRVKADVTPRSKRKNAKPNKLAPPQEALSKRPASSRGMTQPIPSRGPDPKKRRRTGPAKKENAASKDSDDKVVPGRGSDSPSDGIVDPLLIPRWRKSGKATRKTTVSSPAKKRQEEQVRDTSSTEAPRRTLRSRRPISYNYDERGRDLVNAHDGFEVDFSALQPLPTKARGTRSSKSRKPRAESGVSDQYVPRNSLDSPVAGKRARRGQTIRKQVPVNRSRAR